MVERRQTIDDRKFRPPKALRHQVWRERLVERIIRSGDYPLTILLAPAGYGKSTLLRQAGERLAENGAHVAWLTCEPSERETENFIVALRQALAACDTAFERCRPTIPAIMQAMEAQESKFAVFIDDFELLSESEASSVIEFLAALLPTGHRILIGTRSFDEGRLARFMVEDTALVIDAAAMALGDREARQLLGEHCDDRTIDRLMEVSEGWPMMLQLARIKADRPDGHVQLVESLLRPHSELFGFLAKEVVENLPHDLAELLTNCAIVDYVDATIATALTGGDRAEALLASAAVLDPLVSIQAEPVLTLRLHPVMRGYLQQSLARKGSRAVARLHARAARHFAKARDIFRAIEHALQAEDAEFAGEIFEQIGGLLAILSHGPANVWSYLDQMPRPVIEQRPTLIGAQAVIHVTRGDALAAGRSRDALTRLLACGSAGGPLPAEEIADLVDLCLWLLTDSQVPIGHYLDEKLPALEVTMRRRAETEPRALAFFLAMKFFLEIRYGSVAVARETVVEYERVCDQNNYSPHLPSISPHLGMIAFASAEFDKAAWYFSENLAHHWDGFVGREEMLIKVGNSLLAKIFYEQNRIDDALANIRAIPESHEATFMERIEARDITMARCLAQIGDVRDAIDHVDRARHQRALYGLNNSIPAIDALTVELLVHKGDIELARAHFEDRALAEHWHSVQCHGHWNWIFVEAYLRAVTNLCLAEDDTESVLRVVKQIESKANQDQRILVAGLSRIAAAGALELAGERERAASTLGGAMAIHSKADVIRPYFDIAPNIAPVLEQLRDEATDRDMLSYIGRALGLWDENIRSTALARILTPREGDVLAELVKGQPTKLIARNLGVSPETVKHHLKNIFVKLGVENRKDAVSEAYRRAL